MFGERLKYLRESKDITQQDLANILGVSVGTIGMYEIDKRMPNNKNRKKLAEYFGVSTDYLLGLSDEETLSSTSSELTKKNMKDIKKKMADLREEISSADGLMFDGEIMSDETKELLLHLLEKDEISATISNKKYIPKKYRK